MSRLTHTRVKIMRRNNGILDSQKRASARASPAPHGQRPTRCRAVVPSQGCSPWRELRHRRVAQRLNAATASTVVEGGSQALTLTLVRIDKSVLRPYLGPHSAGGSDQRAYGREAMTTNLHASACAATPVAAAQSPAHRRPSPVTTDRICGIDEKSGGIGAIAEMRRPQPLKYYVKGAEPSSRANSHPRGLTASDCNAAHPHCTGVRPGQAVAFGALMCGRVVS